jgi:hypothetical protein
MSLLGFEDGSYLELISSLDLAKTETIFWGKQIRENGGPCAWAVYMDDVTIEAQRLAQLGIPVEGPEYMHRRRPDGQLVEWNLAFLGNKGAGATLPFIIRDITPRERRVRPSPSVASQPGQPALLTGVSKVILGVKVLEAAIDLFQSVYAWPPPQRRDEAGFGATLAHFIGTPVILAAPLGEQSWLAQRLAQFDESPCAYLLETPDFEEACRRFGLIEPGNWFGRPVAWFDPAKLNGARLGVMA